MDAAVAYGAHPSASNPEAAAALRAEALEKVQQKFAKLISWKQLRKQILQGYHKHTKISPIAAIPHKSRLFRMILDLSSKGQRNTTTKSVNELTDETAAPYQSMAELGNVVGRFIVLLANADPNKGPIVFCKLDIKDGFWRMCVPENKELEFCYVLPKLPNDPDPDDIQLVVPAALQMGWTSSPAFFCAATETGRDLADYLQAQPELPPHPLEDHMIDPIDPNILQLPNLTTLLRTPAAHSSFRHLFEVFVDDFCAGLQSTDPAILRHYSRALLHAIHQIFPPPAATGHDGEDPISQKKLILEGEGVWDTRKEILGWIFDGINLTMELPKTKADSLRTAITSLLHGQKLEVKQFESFLGKCQHACFAIPGGKALLAPLYRALHSANRGNQCFIHIHRGSAQAEALEDLRTMFKIIASRPTHCKQLHPRSPDYIGYCDACNYGAGGIWISGIKTIRPIVWRIQWPPQVVEAIQSKKLTINDLEMAGVLLQFLVLEPLVPMRHTQTAVWCDNTSAVSWTNKMSSRRSLIGQQLARALALRLLATEASHLAALSIAGLDNTLADLASRSFKQTGKSGNYNLTDVDFLTKFCSDFPLTPQNSSWLLLRPNIKVSSRVFTLLQGGTLPTGSWTRLPKCGCDIGLTGPTSATSITWAPFSPALQESNELTSSPALPAMYVKGMRVKDTRSASAQFRTRYAPSARPSSWTT